MPEKYGLDDSNVDRFWSLVDKDGSGGCWLWTGGLTQKGYGRFYLGDFGPPDGRFAVNRLAHRLAYDWEVGGLPEYHPRGLQIDHLCRVRNCVNPEHMELVTSRENSARGETWIWRQRLTHCPNGHPYDLAGNRRCDVCFREKYPLSNKRRRIIPFSEHLAKWEARQRRKAVTWQDRFWDKVEKGPGCWLWTGSTHRGWGRFGMPGQRSPVNAHKISFELANGPRPTDLRIWRICRNPLCVKPRHMRLVTKQELGALVGGRGRNANREKTHCKKGHPFDAKNTYYNSKGGRACKTCQREYQRTYSKPEPERIVQARNPETGLYVKFDLRSGLPKEPKKSLGPYSTCRIIEWPVDDLEPGWRLP
jgi:hypothetical protein